MAVGQSVPPGEAAGVDTGVDVRLRETTLAGLAWIGGGRVVQHGAVIVATAALARLLTPRDFGLLAMTAVFTGFAAVFADLGLTAALVQRKTLTDSHLTAALWVNVATSLVLAAVLAAVSPVVAALYDEPLVIPMMLVLVLAFPFSAFAAVQIGLAERTMDFRRLAYVETGAVVVSFAVAIAAAVGGLGVWSLVLQPVVQAAVRSVALWSSSAWRPSGGLDRTAVRELLGFGGHLAGANALNYWIRSVDQFAVGAFSGARQLGLYSRAYQLMLLPLTQVTWVSGRVMFPALSRLAGATERARRVYLRAVTLIAFVTFPLMVVLFVSAVPLIRVLLGSQWTGSVPIFRILCVVGVLQSVTATAGWIYQSHGRTSWMLRWGVVNLIATCIAVAIGVHWGAIGVATAYAIRTVVVAGPVLAISGSLVGLRLRELGRSVAGIVAAAVAAGLVAAAADFALAGTQPVVRLAGDLAAGFGAYIVIVATARLESYRETRTITRQLLRRA